MTCVLTVVGSQPTDSLGGDRVLIVGTVVTDS
jgi:hypothetical protein